MAAAKVEKDIISEEVQSIELYQTAHVTTHAYVAPFVLIHSIFFPVWIFKFGFFENFEIGCIILAVLGVIQVLVCLACHWSIHIRARFTCSRMSDKDELLGVSDEDLEEEDSEVEFKFQLKNVIAGGSDDDDEDGGKTSKLTIDEYLIKTGECGKFQIVMVALMGIAMIPMSFPPMIFYFIGNDPAWSCSKNVTHPNGTFCSSHNSSLVFKHTLSERCQLDRKEWHFANHGRSTLVTDFDLVCKDAWLDALAGSIVFIGWAIGILTLGYLSDQYGRKRIMYPALLLTLLSLAAHALVKNIWQLLVIRFIMGFFYSGPALNHYILSTEIVGPNRRVLSSTIASFAWPIGSILMVVKAYYIKDWRQLSLLASLPYIIGLFTCICVPESFRWLNIKNRTEDAEKILQKAAKCNNSSIMGLALQAHTKTSEERKKPQKVSYIVLFTRCKLFVLMISQGFIWFNCGMTYYALSWAISDLGGDMYTNFLWGTLIEIPAGLVSYLLLNYIGRKKTTIPSFILTALLCFIIACMPESVKVPRLVLGLFGKFMSAICFMSMYMWSSEIYPTCLRTQGMGINIVTSRIGAATSPFIKLLDRIHPTAPYVLLSITCLLSGLLSLLLPKTFKKPTRETLDDVFEDGSSHKVMFSVAEGGTLKIEDEEDTEHLLT